MLPENSLFRVRPELIDEWDFEENEKDGFKIEKITKGSKKKISWICTKSKHKFKQRPLNRSYNQNCPYCSGRLATKENSLAYLKPELASQWHPTLNGDKTPNDVTVRSNKKSLVDL